MSLLLQSLIDSGNVVHDLPEALDGAVPSGYFMYNEEYSYAKKYGTPWILDHEGAAGFKSFFSALPQKEMIKKSWIDLGKRNFEGLELIYYRYLGLKKHMKAPSLTFDYNPLWGKNCMLISKKLGDLLYSSTYFDLQPPFPAQVVTSKGEIHDDSLQYYIIHGKDQTEKNFFSIPECRIDKNMQYSLLKCFSYILDKNQNYLTGEDIIHYQGIVDNFFNVDQYFFSLNCIKKMIDIDPDLVFTPVYQHDDIKAYFDLYERKNDEIYDDCYDDKEWLYDKILRCYFRKLRQYVHRWNPGFDFANECVVRDIWYNGNSYMKDEDIAP